MRIDLHVHSYCSFDALVKPADVFQKVKESKIDGIALTDHNTAKGWKEFSLFANKKGFPFIKGEEIAIVEEGQRIGELLGFFMQEPIKPASFEEVFGRLKEQDALVSVPHPFAWFTVPEKLLSKAVEKRFCIEGFNSRNFLGFMNKKALSFAGKHGLPCTAGSDAHVSQEIGNGFVESSATELEGLRKDLKKGKVSLKGKTSPLFYRLVSRLKAH